MLEEQSHEENDLITARLRKMAGDIFKRYNITEFDYKTEIKTISIALQNPQNYRKVKDLLSSTVTFTGDKNVDACVILGAFALALGNPIDVKEDKVGNATLYQFVPEDFASKSGINNGLNDVGDWIPVEIGGAGELGNSKKEVVRNIKLNRTPFSNSEVIDSGKDGIRRTAVAMKEMTKDYLNNPKFKEDLEKIEQWCDNVLKKRGVTNKYEFLGTLAEELTDPGILRYEKDPLQIKNGRLAAHEWLQRPSKSLSDGVADCDCFSLLCGCIGELMGLGVTYRIAKCNPLKKSAYSHVYPILSYSEGVDGFIGEEDVACDLVYTKRIGFDNGYGKEPKNFGKMDFKVY